MFTILQQQANRIARGNPDLTQDILSMSYDSYQRAQERGKDLTIGELVNLMKYRAGSLRSGERLSFGNLSSKTTKDVFHKSNYFSGNVEILSLDYEEENPGDGRGMFNATIATQDFTDAVLFSIQFERFLDHQSLVNLPQNPQPDKRTGKLLIKFGVQAPLDIQGGKGIGRPFHV